MMDWYFEDGFVIRNRLLGGYLLDVEMYSARQEVRKLDRCEEDGIVISSRLPCRYRELYAARLQRNGPPLIGPPILLIEIPPMSWHVYFYCTTARHLLHEQYPLMFHGLV